MRGSRASAAALALVVGLLAPVAVAPNAEANGCPFIPFGGGTGSTADPFLLRSAVDMQHLAASTRCWGYAYALSSSIDLAGASWTPVGTAANPFTGSFDGRGFTLSGLTVTGSASQAGLFGAVLGSVGNEVVVRRLTLADVAVTGGSQVGSLIGLAEFASISDVSATGTVSGAAQVGGLVGQLGGTARGATIVDAQSAVAVSATGTDAGGLIGLLDTGSSVTSSSASGAVSGSVQVGGLVGLAQGGIAGSSASGPVSATAGAAGGLAGRSASTITSSRASGAVTGGGAGVGGLVGISTGAVTEGSATGTVSAIGQSEVGGLVGDFSGGAAISRSFATGAVTGGSRVGGLVGLLTQSSVTDGAATGAVTGSTGVGGLIGEADIPSVGGVERAYATGAVVASGSPVGGLIAVGRPVAVADGLWAVDSTSQSASPGGGAARTLAELRSLPTFSGWSIVAGTSSAATWGICADVNGGTPFLQWAISPGACAGTGSLPPAFLQQFAAPETGACSNAVPSWIVPGSAGLPPRAGWGRSWAQWPNEGRGGAVCTRTIAFDPAQGWTVVTSA